MGADSGPSKTWLKVAADESSAPLSGRQRSAANSLRHGLTARRFAVLPSEDQSQFDALRAGMIDELAGATPTAFELELVDRIAGLVWRLRRVVQIERDMWLLAENDGRRSNGAKPLASSWLRNLELQLSAANLSRYEVALSRELDAALRRLSRLHAARNGQSIPTLDVSIAR